MNVLQNVKRLVKYNTVSRDSNLPLVDYAAAYLEDLVFLPIDHTRL